MESNKNRFENLKLLFDDLLDTLNESNSALLQQIEELRSEINVLSEKIDLYKEKTQELEERVANLTVSEVLQEKEVILEDKIIADNSLEEVEQEEQEPLFTIDNKYIEQEKEKEEVDISEEAIETVEIPVNEPQNGSEDIAEVLFPHLYNEPKTPVKEVKEFVQVKQQLIMDTVKPEWYDWEVDYPAPYLEDIALGIGFNDRLVFLKELFNDDEGEFVGAINDINKMESFRDAMDYIREHFPYWNEQSDQVYRFYMNVRRKLRK